MRCVSCGVVLNDYEATRRVESTNEFLDMCNKCYKDIESDVPTVGRSDLNPFEYVEDDEDFVDDTDTWLFDNDPDRE